MGTFETIDHARARARAPSAVDPIRDYLYWIAAGDRAYGHGDAARIQWLRALWRSHRVAHAISPFDGASFWLAGGRPHARIMRAAETTDVRVQIIDVDPAAPPSEP